MLEVTHARQALQQAVATGACSPYFAATWETRIVAISLMAGFYAAGVSAPEPQHRDRDEVGDPCNGPEPAVRVAVVAAGELDDERDDDRGDHREAGERRRVDVDHAEAPV